MQITKEMKQQILKEQQILLDLMSVASISKEEWEFCLQRYNDYAEVLNNKNAPKLSLDTMLVVAGNLLGILAILNFEKMDIITTKALGFILKGRV